MAVSQSVCFAVPEVIEPLLHRRRTGPNKRIQPTRKKTRAADAHGVRRRSAPMSGSRTHRAAEIQDAIRQVLLRKWDPISVRDVESCVDEYDSYIAPVYRILVGSRSEDDLIDLLFRSERDLGMCCQSAEQLRPVARALLSLDVRMRKAEQAAAGRRPKEGRA